MPMNNLKPYLKSKWLLPFFGLAGTLFIFFSPLRLITVPHFFLFHTFLETFCFVISLMIFMIQFVLRNYSSSGFYKILGIPFLGIGIIDLLHTLSYQGLPGLVTPNNSQKSIAFWLSARFLEAGTFLFFAFNSKYKQDSRHKREWLIYGTVLVYTVLISVVILGFPEIVPSFVNEEGHLSTLKKGFEYLLILSHLITLYLLTSSKTEIWIGESKDFLLSASLIIAISGLSFSSFSDSQDLTIFWGHLLKVFAYYFIFKAALQSELLQPYYRLIGLNKDLQFQTESLKNIKDLLLKSERLNAVGMNASIALHDLNNMVLIAALSAKKILKLVSENESAEKIKNYSDTIITSLARTQQFQQQLLYQVKSAASKESVLDLQEELKQFTPLLKVLAGNNELGIECEESLKIQINQVELEQVLMNLVVNATDALKPQEGKIIISAKRQKVDSPIESLTGMIKPEHYIKLSVIDNGRGIPAESLPKIFEPFYTTKDVSKGTGLGLPTVKLIVEKWHAYLQARSSLGKGTEFNIFLSEP
jgi:signal transduction histidine kinase